METIQKKLKILSKVKMKSSKNINMDLNFVWNLYDSTLDFCSKPVVVRECD